MVLAIDRHQTKGFGAHDGIRVSQQHALADGEVGALFLRERAQRAGENTGGDKCEGETNDMSRTDCRHDWEGSSHCWVLLVDRMLLHVHAAPQRGDHTPVRLLGQDKEARPGGRGASGRMTLVKLGGELQIASFGLDLPKCPPVLNPISRVPLSAAIFPVRNLPRPVFTHPDDVVLEVGAVLDDLRWKKIRPGTHAGIDFDPA